MSNQTVTNWMRLHLDISRPTGREDEADSLTYNRILRDNYLRHAYINQLCEFNEIAGAMKSNCRNKNVTEREVNDRLRDLLGLATDLINGRKDDPNLAEMGATFLLQTFHDNFYVHKSFNGPADYVECLSNAFDIDCLTNSQINRAYEQCRFLLQLVEDSEEFSFLFTPQSSHSHAKSVDTHLDALHDTEWGPDVTKPPYSIDLFREYQNNELSSIEWDSILLPERKQLDVDFSYSALQAAQSTNAPHTNSEMYDGSWFYPKLEAAIKNNEIGLDCMELFEKLKDMLKSEKTNQEIQEDVFNLLGAENIVLIEQIISSRNDLVEYFRNLDCFDDAPATNGMKGYQFSMPIAMIAADKSRGAVGQSIVVHTEEEKQMKKLLRKIEKKANKEIKNETDTSTISMSQLERMRNERENALLKAMNAPLFKDNSGISRPQVSYPFVFDSYADAKQSAAFIAGHKMILPDGFKREADDKRYEEIQIPACPKPPAQVLEKFPLVEVSSLDAVGQTCFAGFKQLNQIQSIVFDCAYNTNENMLVCAPTGAGKTNIAMLAVAKVIKDHTNSSGSLESNKFKIIYIAPMKALASEMTETFGNRLKPFGIKVRELTGDMQLTRQEIKETHMIVTTPEKWDVVTRKSSEDTNAYLVKRVKCVILDEVHLLQSDRGPVLEALVARTLRFVEKTQEIIRLVGLSATLPNYIDVAIFLSVSPDKGMFFFDNRFRPVPLALSFVGVKATRQSENRADCDDICYEKVHKIVSEGGQQVMVFVHARNATFKFAEYLRGEACKQGHSLHFAVDSGETTKAAGRARSKMLRDLIPSGFAIHHAGLLRQDRTLVEKAFKDGLVKVLVCTSTLAWGVNLPAHAVVIRGTDIYDSATGDFVDVSMLDVMQIFGRAGRPQYDTKGYACIITNHDKLAHYVSMLTQQYPIESSFIKYLADNLNAEISAKTVSSIDEAVTWLDYTYLLIRMQHNPLAYALTYEQLKNDPRLMNRRRELAIHAAENLRRAMMIKYDEDTGSLDATDLGKTASFYYIKYDTIERFNDVISEDMEDDKILAMISKAQEFDQLKCREEEMNELMDLQRKACRLKVPAGIDSQIGKVNILMQSYLSSYRLESFSLISDQFFVSQNIVRMARGLFEYVRKSGWAHLANRLLILSKMFEQQMWEFQSPLNQFHAKELDYDTLMMLDKNKTLVVDNLRSDDFTSKDIGLMIRNESKGIAVKRFAHMLPWLIIDKKAQPTSKTYRRRIGNDEKLITSNVVKISLEIVPDFRWNDPQHGNSQSFWIWVQDHDGLKILAEHKLTLNKKQVVDKEKIKLPLTILLNDVSQVPSHYVLHVDSDRWLGCDIEEDLKCEKLIEIHE